MTACGAQGDVYRRGHTSGPPVCDGVSLDAQAPWQAALGCRPPQTGAPGVRLLGGRPGDLADAAWSVRVPAQEKGSWAAPVSGVEEAET